MSFDILSEITQLRATKDQLLRSLHSFSDLHDDTTKATIFNTLNNFMESLKFLRSETEFELGINLNDSITTHSKEITDAALAYGEFEDFLTNFKKSIVTKQLQLRASQITSFNENKRQKFRKSLADEDSLKELEQSRKDLSNIENLSTDAKVMSTTKKITTQLVHSSQILQTSLVQSQLNLEELQIQDDELTRLADRYTAVGALLQKSDEFVKDIKLSAAKDKKMMIYALIFFSAAVLWVLYSRLLKIPIKMFWFMLWYSIKLVFLPFTYISSSGSNPDTDSAAIASSMQLTITSTTEAAVETIPGYAESVGSVVDDVSSTLSEVLAQETGDEFDTVLGRIIDEL